MRLKSIQVTNFKRFADLQIRNLPPTARLILLLGPNGCGKSSIFDAFHSHLKMSRFIGINSNLWDYFDRLSSLARKRVKSRVVCKSERKLLDASVRLPWRPPSVREAVRSR